MQNCVNGGGERGGSSGYEWNAFVHVSLHLKSRSPKALEKQCLFRDSLCFQLIFLVSSKRLYNIHMIWLIFK